MCCLYLIIFRDTFLDALYDLILKLVTQMRIWQIIVKLSFFVNMLQVPATATNPEQQKERRDNQIKRLKDLNARRREAKVNGFVIVQSLI